MKLIVAGLGKMGAQCVAKFAAAGHEVIALDPDKAAVAAAVAVGALEVADRASALARFGTESPVVWLMIPADAVEAEVAEWLSVLPSGSMLVDGGNSNFAMTRRRADQAAAKGIRFVDVGTSGGIMGASHGFALMVGGEKSDFDRITPLCAALCAPHGSFMHVGPSGSGHYVKMVHNGIEYGLMQAYAEGYHLLRDSRDYPGLDLAGVARVWQHGSIIASKLNELAHKILKANPDLAGVDGYVAATGEAAWAKETAEKQDMPMAVLDAALEVRRKSQAGTVSYATKLLAAMRNAFGGHDINR